MGSIHQDSQAKARNVKYLDNGKDRRITLRKALDNEPRHPIPADVVEMARRREFVFRSEPSINSGFSIETQNGDDDGPGDMMGFIEYYIADYGQTHRPGSIQRMSGILRHYQRFLATTDNAPKLVSQVGDTHIMAWFQWRREQRDTRLKITLKPWVVVGETELLSGLFRLAVDRGKLAVNPCNRVLDKLRKAHPRPDPADETKYIESEKLPTFLNDNDKAVTTGKVPADYADLARIMLATGLRVEAALQMEYAWVGTDWIVKVPAEFDKCKTGYTTVVAPGGRPVLTRRRGLWPAGRVFPRSMTQAMRLYYLGKLGLTNHTLRHSFATALVDLNVPIQTIGALLGHKHIKTTQPYAKVRDEAKVAAVAMLSYGT